MATLLRTGKLAPFTEAKPGPKAPRKATGAVREQALALRADGRSVGEIAAALADRHADFGADGMGTSRRRLPRLDRRDETRRGSPAKLTRSGAPQPSWPTGATIDCPHAGCCCYSRRWSSSACTSWSGRPAIRPPAPSPAGSRSAPCCWRSAHAATAPTTSTRSPTTPARARARLTALPKATHVGSYSYRVALESNTKLLTGLVKALRPLGMASGAEGFNLDFHAIRHHGDDTVLENTTCGRSQRIWAALTFFAQDHASTEMVYANAEITKTEQAREILAFADYWQPPPAKTPATGIRLPADHLHRAQRTHRARHRLLTLRQRGKTDRPLTALPAAVGRDHRPLRPIPAATVARRHDQLKDVDTKVRQIAVRNIGRDEPTLSSATTSPPPPRPIHPLRQRMSIENELDAYISGFHLDALSSASHSTSTSTPPSPSSPATSTASSPATSPATTPPPQTPSAPLPHTRTLHVTTTRGLRTQAPRHHPQLITPLRHTKPTP